MNRTIVVTGLSLLSLLGPGVAQQPAKAPSQGEQAARVQQLVAEMRAAEAALEGIRMRLRTRARMPNGDEMTTNGELRVLRGTQSGAARSTYSELEYRFAEGIAGRTAAAQTKDGVLVYEENSALGAVHVQIQPVVLTDIEWAAGVLGRDDLYGMPDGRAEAPLGSAMVADLTLAFGLDVVGPRDGDPVVGRWVVGRRKPGLDEEDPELPLVDRVELFVRDQDHALLVARFYVEDEVVQEVVVDELVVDPEFDEQAFRVDGHGVRVRDVREYPPMWEQIEKVLEQAEARAYTAAKAAANGRSEQQLLLDAARPSRRARLEEDLRREAAGGQGGQQPREASPAQGTKLEGGGR